MPWPFFRLRRFDEAAKARRPTRLRGARSGQGTAIPIWLIMNILPEHSDTVAAALPPADRRLVRAAQFRERLAAIAHRQPLLPGLSWTRANRVLAL